jgi:tetratricopeptide (TPR) repeat protein
MGNHQASLEYYQECWRMVKERGLSSLYTYANLTVPRSIAYAYWHLGNYQESLRNYLEALDITRGLGDRFEEASILSYISAIYSALGNDRESINNFQEVLKIYRELGDRASEARVLSLIGNVYRQNLHDYTKAHFHYKEALEIKKEISNTHDPRTSLRNSSGSHSKTSIESSSEEGEIRNQFDREFHADPKRTSSDDDEIRSLLNNLGIVCWNLGFYEEALSYYKEALEICRNTGNKIGEGIALSGMGVVYLSLSKHEEALKSNQEALNILKATGDQKVEGYILNSIGNVYYEMRDYQMAWRCYQDSLRIRKELGDKRGEGWVLYHLGMVYRSLKNYEEAMKHYKEALSLADEIAEEALKVNSENALSEIKGVN